jgi:hypothetical protein
MRDFRFFAFRDTPQAGAAIEAAAKEADVSLSGWLREAARRHLPEGGAALPPLRPSRPRRPVVIPEADVAAVARLIGEVGKLTGATVQLAKVLRETGYAPGHQSAESILRDLRTTQTSLVRIVDRLRAAGAAT